MAANTDQSFFRAFAVVLASLIAITIIIILGVGVVIWSTADDGMRPEQMTRVKSRTQPVYAVNTDPNATKMVAASDSGGGGGGKPMSGEQVFGNVCTACHTAGVAGAPKVTDTAEWKKRLSGQGKKTLYKRAINGYKGMPAKGGNPDLSKDEMHNAVDYILGKSGAA